MVKLSQIGSHFKFIFRKPKVFPRILRGYFKKRILRQDVLRTVDWAVTYNCNFNCSFCSARILMAGKKDKKELTPEQIKTVWEQAVQLGVIHVNLTGGEPLLVTIDKLCQIIRNFQPERFLVSLVTNGSLLTEEKIKKLKQSGLDTLQLSIDSFYPEVHDRLRRAPGSHKHLMDCLQWAKKHQLNLCISTVLTRYNFEDIQKLSEFVKKEGQFILLNPVSSSGALQGNEDPKLKQEDLKRYYQLLNQKHARADTVLNFTGRSECPAGKERIEITAYGEVMTCPHVQVSYGNVLKEPLKAIHKRMCNFPPLKKYSKHCKHVFDQDYIQTMVQPLTNFKELPVSILDHPYVKDNETLREQLRKS